MWNWAWIGMRLVTIWIITTYVLHIQGAKGSSRLEGGSTWQFSTVSVPAASLLLEWDQARPSWSGKLQRCPKIPCCLSWSNRCSVSSDQQPRRNREKNQRGRTKWWNTASEGEEGKWRPAASGETDKNSVCSCSSTVSTPEWHQLRHKAACFQCQGNLRSYKSSNLVPTTILELPIHRRVLPSWLWVCRCLPSQQEGTWPNSGGTQGVKKTRKVAGKSHDQRMWSLKVWVRCMQANTHWTNFTCLMLFYRWECLWQWCRSAWSTLEMSEWNRQAIW